MRQIPHMCVQLLFTVYCKYDTHRVLFFKVKVPINHLNKNKNAKTLAALASKLNCVLPAVSNALKQGCQTHFVTCE